VRVGTKAVGERRGKAVGDRRTMRLILDRRRRRFRGVIYGACGVAALAAIRKLRQLPSQADADAVIRRLGPLE
jgi:hypothetical protein